MENATAQPPPESPKCPACGTALPAGALAGLCPACLLKQGIAADTATRSDSPTFVPPPIPEIASLFPQLEIIRLLGKGGMGAVYLARQPALDRMVALKILPARNPANPSDSGFAERFTREARALAKLSHPNIVAVHEFGQAGALHYFLMEFVDGVTLRQLQKSGRLSAHEALQIVPQLCDALQYAHDEGVVHRDIKPENVLVDRRGRVKIADFGLAKILGVAPGELRLTGEGQVMGTPHYMSPEQVEHPLEVDHRSDIYSLGVVFYEMLTGELPLGRFAPPSRKVQIDVRLDDIVLRTLEKEPERRYQQVSEVKTRMASLTQTPGVISPPPISTATDESGKELADILQQVKWPAMGLVFTGCFNWIILLVDTFFCFAFFRKLPGPVVFYMFLWGLMILAAGVLLLVGGLKMKGLKGYPLALAASIAAIIVPPGQFIGLPIGVWSLVVLSRRQVRDAFRAKKHPPMPTISSNRASITSKLTTVGCGIVLFLVLIVGLAIAASIILPAFARNKSHAQIQKALNESRQRERDREKLLTETWSPTLVDGEKPVPQKISQEAKSLMEKGQYEESLQRYLWYFNHALEYDESLSGVRISFILSDWVELGRRYPKAKQALLGIRDRDLKKFAADSGYFALFQEVYSIDQYLQDDDVTVTLFHELGDKDIALARQCFFIAEPLLVKNHDYALCMNYLGEPQAVFERLKENREHLKTMEDQWAAKREEAKIRLAKPGVSKGKIEEYLKTAELLGQLKSSYENLRLTFKDENPLMIDKKRRIEEMEQRKEKMEAADPGLLTEHPELPVTTRTVPFGPPRTADKTFVKEIRQLIEILVANNDKANAQNIQTQALAVLDDARIRSAITDVEAQFK